MNHLVSPLGWWQKYLLSLFMVLALAGCTSNNVKMLPAFWTATTVLTPNEGIVVVRVVDAGNSALPFNHLSITPLQNNPPEENRSERLIAVDAPMTNSVIFAAPVTAGNYSFRNLLSFHIKQATGDTRYSYTRWAVNPKLGRFSVKGGQVTDLGTLIHYPAKPQDEPGNILLRLPPDTAGEVIDKFFSFYRYDKNNVLGWNEDGFDKDRAAFVQQLAKQPMTFNHTYLAPDDSIYFIGKLGTILNRTAQGEWQTDTINTALDLSGIVQNEQSDLLVGGNEGRLFLKLKGADWQDISLDSQADIAQVAFYSDATLHAFAREASGVSIYTADLNKQPIQWAKSAYLGAGGKKRLMAITVARQKNQHTIAIATQSKKDSPYFHSTQTTTYQYDPVTWKFTKNSTDDAVAMSFDAGAVKFGLKISFMSQDYFIKKRDGSWSEVVNYVSNRQKSKYFRFSSVPVFTSQTQGTAIVSFDWGKETKIVKTKDGGQSWRTTDFKVPKPYCLTLVPQVTDRLLLMCKGASVKVYGETTGDFHGINDGKFHSEASGDFYESLDEGETWQLVRNGGRL